MKAARLLELRAQVKEAPEGVAVRIDSQELAWLLAGRDAVLEAMNKMLEEINGDLDITENGGPNYPMRLINTHGDRIERAVRKTRVAE